MRMNRKLVSAASIGLFLAPSLEAQQPQKYWGRAFIFQADLDKARSYGWLQPETTDDEALQAVADGLLNRVRTMGRFPEAQVAREDDGIFSVTFVGKMADNMERFLEAGLSNPGHLAYRVVASDADLADAGTDLAEQRQRLDAWLAAHEGKGPTDFNLVPADAGGPHPALRWLPRINYGDGVRETAPLAVLEEFVHGFAHADLAQPMRRSMSDAGELTGFGLDLSEISSQALHAFEQAHQGRELAFVINDHVAATEPTPTEPRTKVLVEAAIGMDAYRALLLGFSGGAIDVPLTFVEHSKRELLNVARRAPEKDAPAPEKGGK